MSIVTPKVTWVQVTSSMHISLDQYANTANSVKLDLFIFIISPVAHLSHVCATGVVLFVPFRQDCVFVKTVGKPPAFVGLDPGVVVESSFDIPSILVSMKPNIYYKLATNFLSSTPES